MSSETETRSDAASRGRGRHARDPEDIPAKGWKAIAKRVWSEIREDQVPVVAAGLAFYAILAVFPALIAAISIYALVVDPGTVQQQIVDLTSDLPTGAASVIEDQMLNIVQSSSQSLSWALAGSLLGALWSASSGTQQLIRAVNNAYDEEEGRGFFKLRGVALLFTLGFIVIGLISLGLLVGMPALLATLDFSSPLEQIFSIGRFVLLGAVIMLVLAVIYRYAPHRDEPEWEWVSWGSVIATVIWIIASILFAVYVTNFGNFNETYGSLAGVVILLLWFYISGFIILLGAEINSEIEHQTAIDTTVGEPEPMGERGAQKADTLPEDPDE